MAHRASPGLCQVLWPQRMPEAMPPPFLSLRCQGACGGSQGPATSTGSLAAPQHLLEVFLPRGPEFGFSPSASGPQRGRPEPHGGSCSVDENHALLHNTMQNQTQSPLAFLSLSFPMCKAPCSLARRLSEDQEQLHRWQDHSADGITPVPYLEGRSHWSWAWAAGQDCDVRGTV